MKYKLDTTSADDQRWQAVVAKSKDMDGEFVFAVTTTGIYCRPSCPAKTAKRANVAFFATTRMAQAAGFRACKRCKPDGTSHEHIQNELMQQACELMQDSVYPLTLKDLARRLDMNQHTLQRVFKATVGVTPKEYQQALIKARLLDALEKPQTITQAIYEAGFNSSGRFYDGADALLGMTPSSFRQGGQATVIHYSVKPCALGMILVAVTARGVCAIELGDSSGDLSARIHQRFPNARIEAADPEFDAWLGQALASMKHPRSLRDLPLDIQGTVFQRRVWKMLQEIFLDETVHLARPTQRNDESATVCVL